MIFTGEIKDAFLLKTDSPPVVEFIYGTIVYDRSGNFKPDDWISTSYLVELRELDDGFAAITQNSVYRIDSYVERQIPWVAEANIRTGTDPDVAMRLVNGTRTLESK